ncbi:DUF108 domain-containing protein [Mesorhizobium sp. M1088]|uniref:aspartate dehydrogenase domain-containing protein n=1 Tax=Mesorhizobium sp. M1088 TaxID=2957056 RepID=UPI003335D29C
MQVEVRFLLGHLGLAVSVPLIHQLLNGRVDGSIDIALAFLESTGAEAARHDPRNLNAGLTVALAAGPTRTKARGVANLAKSLSTHELEAKCAYGDAFMRFANRPSPENPKTPAIKAARPMADVERRVAALDLRRPA